MPDLGVQSAKDVYTAPALAALRPDERLTVSEWADKYRILSGRASSEPGPWRTERTPYLREIMDGLSPHDEAEMIVVQKGAQLGFTEAGNNWIGYVIDHDPGPMLCVKTDLQSARLESRMRIKPMIEDSPRLSSKVKDPRERDGGNTTLVKEFPGGIMRVGGAHAEGLFRMMPVRYLFFDEVDGAPEKVDTGVGEPLSMGIRRTIAWKRNRKIYIPSTPNKVETSRIEPWFQRGDQRYYEVPCPFCGVYQVLKWSQIEWDSTEHEDGTKEHHTETVRYKCIACGGAIRNHHKNEMLPLGEWVPTTKPRDPRVRSYHINGLYSPVGMASWEDIVLDFLEAVRQKKRGDTLLLEEWTNQVLAETWADNVRDIEEGALASRRRDYPAPVPEDVVIITAGVDIQTDRIELEVVGWTPDFESYGITYRVLEGDTNQPDVWAQLDVTLAETFTHELGDQMRIHSICIDSGFRATKVYNFVKHHPGRGMYATKGKAGWDRPNVSSPQKKRSGRDRRPVKLYTVGVDPMKSQLYSRLLITSPGPGYCHFPTTINDEYNEEFFEQLTSERLVKKRVRGRVVTQWIKKRDRNEALDTRILATAALEIAGKAAIQVAARRIAARRAALEANSPESATKNVTVSRRRRRSSWVTRGRK